MNSLTNCQGICHNCSSRDCENNTTNLTPLEKDHHQALTMNIVRDDEIAEEKWQAYYLLINDWEQAIEYNYLVDQIRGSNEANALAGDNPEPEPEVSSNYDKATKVCWSFETTCEYKGDCSKCNIMLGYLDSCKEKEVK